MVRKLRLTSGVVLLFYLSTHLLNHALGAISLEALEAGRQVFLGFWRFLPVSLVLYGALFLHMGLAFWALYHRRQLSMTFWEWTQLILGLTIPPLLVLHVLGTRMAHEIYGLHDSYIYLLLIYFVESPVQGIRHFVLIAVAWLHGAIGLHFWLRLKAWYGPLLPYVFACGVLLPVVAALGLVDSGKDVIQLSQDETWRAAAWAEARLPGPDAFAVVFAIERGFTIGYLLLLGLVLAARLVRQRIERRRGLVVISYPNGRRASVTPGTTILEASRGAGIPHASVCGGRGRCSTCRVRIGKGLEALPLANDQEIKVLARIGAASNVRLACQTPPSRDVEVTPLLPPGATPRAARPRPGYLQGEEREIAILFADLRGFTTLSEQKLPYDVVFILNRYFAAMGEAVEEAGGRVDKFIGDGVMALFGVEGGVEKGCRDALSAARRMGERLAELNDDLAHDLAQPLRIGIGIHSGAVIVGEMGYGPATSITAIGDAVNTASRLEAMTKDYGAQLVLSAPVAAGSGADLATFPRHDIEVRGRQSSLAVHVVDDARKLPDDGP